MEVDYMSVEKMHTNGKRKEVDKSDETESIEVNESDETETIDIVDNIDLLIKIKEGKWMNQMKQDQKKLINLKSLKQKLIIQSIMGSCLESNILTIPTLLLSSTLNPKHFSRIHILYKLISNRGRSSGSP